MLTWLTAYLAKQSSWTEDYILKMPFFKVLLYVHSFNVLEGANTKWLTTASNIEKIEMEELNNLIEAI